jgi:hypothetical protein
MILWTSFVVGALLSAYVCAQTAIPDGIPTTANKIFARDTNCTTPFTVTATHSNISSRTTALVTAFGCSASHCGPLYQERTRPTVNGNGVCFASGVCERTSAFMVNGCAIKKCPGSDVCSGNGSCPLSTMR